MGSKFMIISVRYILSQEKNGGFVNSFELDKLPKRNNRGYTISDLKNLLKDLKFQIIEEVSKEREDKVEWSCSISSSTNQPIEFLTYLYGNSKEIDLLFIGDSRLDNSSDQLMIAKEISKKYEDVLFYNNSGAGFLIDRDASVLDMQKQYKYTFNSMFDWQDKVLNKNKI